MNLVSTRIITENVGRLAGFYEEVTGMKVTHYTTDFVELKMKTATLAIGSTKTLQFFGGDEVAKACYNKSSIIEFLVENVDEDYERLSDFLKDSVVQKPTIMPWGNKSFLFRDLDGNLVNFFTPMSKEAIDKFR
ncbi:VOC family protein [Chryseobacterium sp.]|uniref:VOC family protein n=1 Tax=Chryseobacterium sp. TaxID=1871047 RepID=UPI00289C72A9|nr:VOC family protein [Chryseobacterium sp.]